MRATCHPRPGQRYGCGRAGRPRGRRAPLLLEGHRRGQPVDRVHLGNAQLVEQPAGVGGDRFEVSALRLGDKRHGAWLFYLATFPLTQLDTPANADYKKEIRPYLEPYIRDIDMYYLREHEAGVRGAVSE